MNLGKLNPIDDDRGVSPAVGVIFVIGFVVLVGMGLFLFGQGLITSSDDPREDANFELDIHNVSSWDMFYENGDDFNSDNTDRLYLIGETADGEDIGEVILYDGADVVESDEPQGVLDVGTIVLSSDRAQENDPEIGPGTSLRVVWEPADRDDMQIIIDEMVIPDEATIIQQSEQEGEFEGETSIDTGGCDPREEECE